MAIKSILVAFGEVGIEFCVWKKKTVFQERYWNFLQKCTKWELVDLDLFGFWFGANAWIETVTELKWMIYDMVDLDTYEIQVFQFLHETSVFYEIFFVLIIVFFLVFVLRCDECMFVQDEWNRKRKFDFCFWL